MTQTFAINPFNLLPGVIGRGSTAHAQVQSAAPLRRLLKGVSMRLRRSSFERPSLCDLLIVCAVLQELQTLPE